MRFVIASCMVALTAHLAWADGVSLKQAVKELRARGAVSVQGALISGAPYILANLDDQSMTLRLNECLDVMEDCRVATFSTCQEFANLSRDEAMTITNAYAAGPQSRGAAYVEGHGSLGQKLCVRLRTNLHAEDKFDLADIFDWQLTMRDYFEYTKGAVSDIQIRSLLVDLGGASR